MRVWSTSSPLPPQDRRYRAARDRDRTPPLKLSIQVTSHSQLKLPAAAEAPRRQLLKVRPRDGRAASLLLTAGEGPSGQLFSCHQEARGRHSVAYGVWRAVPRTVGAQNPSFTLPCPAMQLVVRAARST
jgi:hypothetical protein